MTIGIDVRLWKQTGIGRYIRNLVSELLEIDNHNQYILFIRSEDIEEIKFMVHGSRFIVIPADIRWHSISEQIEFPRLLNKYNLDLVHFPYFSVPVFYKKPYVVTVHDLIINHFPTGRATTLPAPIYKIKRAGYNLVLKNAVKNAKKIITPSEATLNEIIKTYNVSKNKIVVTPEGVDESINTFSPVIFRGKNPYFLYVGNAYPHKNLERFIEAFSIFGDKHSEFVLKLVGKEDYFYKRLKGYTRKNKIDNVEFLGFVPDENLSKLYSQAYATFIPSLMEGFGLTALEAMKLGSLTACSEILSLEEICGKDSLYFDPNDILSIEKVMEKAVNLSDKEKKEMMENGKKRAEKFTWKKTARLTLDVYNSCL